MIKSLLRPLTRQLRATLSKISMGNKPSHGRMAVRNRYIDIKQRLETESPIIVDGGANNGATISMFLGQYHSPTIYAFEPIPELATSLKQEFFTNTNVEINGAALGAEKRKIGFNIVSNKVSSSALLPSQLSKRLHGKKMDIQQVVEVQQVRLDEILKDIHRIDLLKLDIQGYELEALKGCGSLLEHVRIITTEVEFVPLYDDQPLYGDIDVYLRTHGFKLLNLYDLFTHADGQLTAGDAVYLNTRHF